ncbi:hypothetical protein G6F50_018178 [Rhizopus delemar]|uniref:Uncharacterized protein n=1 Tax=Rhizopus delemar TaxID=936053 RepID=A0A9P6XNG1_9FUNG|nr:hypothetical protein G6F50_018178 [Rhizopus delemar]
MPRQGAHAARIHAGGVPPHVVLFAHPGAHARARQMQRRRAAVQAPADDDDLCRPRCTGHGVTFSVGRRLDGNRRSAATTQALPRSAAWSGSAAGNSPPPASARRALQR